MKTPTTRGPWKRTTIATRQGTRHFLHIGERCVPTALVAVVQAEEADAALMARAPDLAEALRGFLATHQGGKCRCTLCAQARKALG